MKNSLEKKCWGKSRWGIFLTRDKITKTKLPFYDSKCFGDYKRKKYLLWRDRPERESLNLSFHNRVLSSRASTKNCYIFGIVLMKKNEKEETLAGRENDEKLTLFG